ncbi:hypothetical protein HPO96_11465 [Kribbella sandramycini]|uniref:Uncharacterized protein n=1 Tax=Kribbella sandramycini TaxID=60450 RepID=A0A7Y4P082_9ACTN|nr:hypothetical protein [Kribbella sandramycini]MBB6569296.1 hypothetical protein [Kribbella sandramycini]NOL40865.1 hypothetical protein [Kribbella sandramycini]
MSGGGPGFGGNDAHLGSDSDEANSAWNNHGSYYLAMFDHENFRGSCIYLEPKSWVWRLSQAGGWEDQITSIRWHANRPSGCLRVGEPV